MANSWHVLHQTIPEEIIRDKRLGRHFKYDSRSARYPYQRALEDAALADQLWERMIPVLDQGDVGSCTGNAETGSCGTKPFFDTLPAGTVLDETMALKIYSAAETIDGDGPYPPQDNGSSGTSAAQAAKNLGLISGYTHATSSAEMADALQSGPVIVGVNWYSSFDTPASDGTIAISKGAYVRGGHEFVVRGVKVGPKTFQADNSWGTSWGNNGSMQFSWSTMDRLFSEQGDCTVSVPLSQPAPTPIPVPPQPVPVDADQVFAAVLKEENDKDQAWVDQRHSGYVTVVARSGRTWLTAKGL